MTRSLLKFTNNAVERYQMWYAPELSFDACRVELETEGLNARKTGQRSANKDADLWELPMGGGIVLTLIVKGAADDVREHEGGTVVGMLPPRFQEPADVERAEALHATASERFAQAERRKKEASAAVGLAKDSREREAAKRADAAAGKDYNAAVLERAVLADHLRTLKHEMTSLSQAKKLREALRIALKGLRDAYHVDRNANAAWFRLKDLDPGLLTDEFIDLRENSDLTSAEPPAKVESQMAKFNVHIIEVDEHFDSDQPTILAMFPVEADSKRQAVVQAKERFEREAPDPDVIPMYLIRVYEDYKVVVKRVTEVEGI